MSAPMIEYADNLKKHTRLLVRKGIETHSIKHDDIVLFYTENKVVFVLDKQEQKYIYNKTLTELEEELDPHEFFRVNRQYIVHIDAIKCFKPYERVKLQVRLNLANTPHTIIVSQHTAPSFKKWICNA
jgi:DNA-binding LytR/AlgR family response regulator